MKNEAFVSFATDLVRHLIFQINQHLPSPLSTSVQKRKAEIEEWLDSENCPFIGEDVMDTSFYTLLDARREIAFYVLDKIERTDFDRKSEKGKELLGFVVDLRNTLDLFDDVVKIAQEKGVSDIDWRVV